MLGSMTKGSGAPACFSALDKAIKTFRLYDGRGELCTTAIESLSSQFSTFFENSESLVLDLTGQGFKVEGRLMSAEDRGGQGYYAMFKDGLRQLTILRGIDQEETEKLVKVLATRNQKKQEEGVPSAGGELVEEDTVTRLWDANFQRVRYDAIDSFVEGDVFVPELDKKMSLVAWVNTKMEAYEPELMDAWQRNGPPLKNASSPPGIEPRALLSLQPAAALPPQGVEEFRRQYKEDQNTQMERFSVIWGQMVEEASDDQSKKLVRMMVGLINEWMDEGHWSGLLRTFLVLRRLSEKARFKNLVTHIVQEVASPVALNRLKPHLEEIQPQQTRDALRFHMLLGRPGLETLCRLLADLPPGPIIEGFEKSFMEEKVNPMGMYLARLRSRETLPVVHSIRRLTPMATHPMVTKALRQVVQRDEREVRNAALRPLRGDSSPEALTGLGKALFDPDTKVRKSAIRALARSPHPIGCAALLERLNEKEFRRCDSEERSQLFAALLRMPGEEPLLALRELLGKNRILGGKNIRPIQAEIQDAIARSDSPSAKALLGREGGQSA